LSRRRRGGGTAGLLFIEVEVPGREAETHKSKLSSLGGQVIQKAYFRGGIVAARGKISSGWVSTVN